MCARMLVCVVCLKRSTDYNQYVFMARKVLMTHRTRPIVIVRLSNQSGHFATTPSPTHYCHCAALNLPTYVHCLYVRTYEYVWFCIWHTYNMLIICCTYVFLPLFTCILQFSQFVCMQCMYVRTHAPWCVLT